MLRLSDADIVRLNRAYRNDTNRVYRPAVLGDSAGNIPDSQLPGNVLIRTLGVNGLSVGRSVSLGEDSNIVYEPNTPVRIGKDRQRRDAAIGSDHRGYMASGINPVAILQRQSSSSTTPGNIEMLRCVQESPPSLNVKVKSWVPIVNGLVYLFGGADIDLTAAVPTTGDMLYAVVAVTSDYTTLEYATSTARGEFDVPLDAADIQEAINGLASDSTPVWAIKLVGDQTTITQSNIDNDGQDLRNFVNAVQAAPSGTLSVAIYEEQQTSGTQGGTFTSGADRTRAINTEVSDPDNIATLSSNQITLTNAGTYEIDWWGTAFRIDNHQTILYNVTGSADLARGRSAITQPGGSADSVSHGAYIWVASAGSTLELRHRCTTTQASNGFGVGAGLGVEVYSQVIIRKIA